MENEIYQAPEATPAAEPVIEQPVAKKSNKKLFIIAGIVVAIVAAILIINPFGGKGANKYTTPLDLTMDYMNAKSYNAEQSAELKQTAQWFSAGH